MINNRIQALGEFSRYILKAKSKYRVHSPFVYGLYTSVILDRKKYPEYEKVERIRKHLLQQKSLLETTDFGAAGSPHGYRTRFRQVRDVTRRSSVSPRYGQLIHRLVKHFRPDEIFEIGTAMGISTLYMATAAPQSRITTLEGCAVIANGASESFKKSNRTNIRQIVGAFETTLPKAIAEFDKIDFVFLDGNHRQKATIDYFRQVLPKLHDGSIVVIDDIHWSKGMCRAWKEIISMPEVIVSIDLFRTGLLFFRQDVSPEDHILRF